jgi:hypothetical protein
MSDTLTVIVPAVPVRALSPNASRKQHWGTAHREREALRAATHLATRNTLNAQNGQRPGPPYGARAGDEWMTTTSSPRSRRRGMSLPPISDTTMPSGPTPA